MVEGEALVTGFCVEKGRGRCDSEEDGEEEELRDGKWKSVALDSAEVPRPHPRLLRLFSNLHRQDCRRPLIFAG
jgi:hypothetical protein